MDRQTETTLLLWQFLELLDKENQKEKRFWVHPINQKRNIPDFIRELRNDPDKFYNYCRMSMETFDELLNLVEDRIKKQNTNYRRCISAEERLIITLRFLATGDCFKYIHYNMRIGATTAREIISETCSAIWEVLSPIYLMTSPTPEKWQKVADQFEDLWNYPNVCGCVDGKHIRIQQPYHKGSAFYNYKNYHSIVLQAVVDAEGNFLIIDVGEAGRQSDGGVFTASNFGRNFIEQTLNLPQPRRLDRENETLFPYVFLGDEAYSLNRNFMKPFARASLTSDKKKIYNYRHSRARRIVECAFGMMSRKFRIFERPMLIHPDFAKLVTSACCLLHNMIRKKEGTIADVHDEIINFEECDIQRETTRVRASRAAYQVRENFTDYFISPAGSVSWQERMALHVDI